MSPADDIKHFLVTRDVTRRKTTVVELGTDYEAAQLPLFVSAPGPIRTADLSLRRRALYPLSYGRLCLQIGTLWCCVGRSGSGLCVPFAHIRPITALYKGA